MILFTNKSLALSSFFYICIFNSLSHLNMRSTICRYSIISIFLFLSCTGWKDKRNMESDIITANLERRDNVSTKELFSDIQVIPLETTPESLIRDIPRSSFLRADIISMIIEDPKSLFSTGRDVSNSHLTKKETARGST